LAESANFRWKAHDRETHYLSNPADRKVALADWLPWRYTASPEPRTYTWRYFVKESTGGFAITVRIPGDYFLPSKKTRDSFLPSKKTSQSSGLLRTFSGQKHNFLATAQKMHDLLAIIK